MRNVEVINITPKERAMLLSMEYYPTIPNWRGKIKKSIIIGMIFLLGFTMGMLFSLMKTISY